MGILSRIKSHPGFRSEPVLFSLVQCLYWASNSALYSFVVMYFRSLGYSSAVCGLATGSLWMFSLIVQPLMGYLTDTYITCKSLLLIFFTIAVPTSFLVPLASKAGGLIFVALIGQSILDNYQYCIIDSWVIQKGREKSYIDYGRIRSFGSLGYALAALLMGWLIDGLGYWVMFAGHSLLIGLCALCILKIEAVPCLNKKGEAVEKSLSMGEVLSMLVKNKKYVIFISAVVFYQFGIRPTTSYFSMVMDALGGNSAHVGLGTFTSAIGEVLIMMIVSRLIRRGIRMELIFGVALLCGVVRMIIMSLPLGIPAIIIGQLVSSITIGTYIRVFVQYITELTPTQISASATTIATAFSFFMGGVIGNLTGGFLMDYFGTVGYLLICAGSMAVAFIVFLPIFLPVLRETIAKGR